MKLTHFIIHEIEKETEKTNPTSHAPKIILKSTTEFPVANTACITFATKLRERYSSSISGYGCIENTPNSVFHSQLKDYQAGNLDFIPLSHRLLERLEKNLGSGKALQLATGGLLVLIEYEENQKTFMLVSMIKEKTAITFDKTLGNLEEILSIDLEKLHEGARIDLEKWKNDIQPNVSFIKKSVKVTDYFRDAINCINYQNTETYTNIVHETLNAFGESEEWDDGQLKDKRKILREYFIQSLDKKTNGGKPRVFLKELSAILTPDEPEKFYNYIRTNEIEVSDEFQPDSATVNRWKRITVKTGSINVTFDVSDLEDEKIALIDGKIIISNVSQQVKDKFDEIKKNN